MKFRWYITKTHLVALIGILVACIILLALTGCIPVTVRPEFDDKGLPIALPVTPAGAVSPEGVFTPVYPVSVDAPPQPQPFPWGDILNIGLGLLGVAGGGYGLVAAKLAGKAKDALRIACSLADANANAETDLDVERNKMIAAQQQAAAGVAALTQAVRGKSK
jgi:hypothetical protein